MKEMFLHYGWPMLMSLALGWAVFLACARSVPQPDRSAAEYYRSVVNNPNFKTCTGGESFCWHAAAGMDGFLKGYRLTGDTSWLSLGVNYYDFVIDRMKTGPDGYKGWIGPYDYDPQYWADVHVGDGVVMAGILEFSALVLKEEPALAGAYGDKARGYVEIAKRDIIEKWDRRDTWRQDGPCGNYVFDHKYLLPEKTDAWVVKPEVKNTGLSLPFNQQNELGRVCLLLHRITGDPFYKDRAEKIFLRMKHSFHFFEDHYVWPYWEPFGPWDIDLEKKTTRHWVGVHGHRNYQAMEAGQIAEAFHHGVVFDSVDLQRIINTNLKVMWNGDREHPGFVNSNATHARLPPAAPGEQRAGVLWTGLADFDRTIRDLARAGKRDDADRSIEALYFRQVVLREPPGFKRKYVDGPVTVPHVEFTECRDINMAVALPAHFKKGETTLLVHKSWKPGTMEIAVYDQAGRARLAVLHNGPVPGGASGREGIFVLTWDGKDPATGGFLEGALRVRWSLGSDYRERPVNIIEGDTR